MVATGNAASRGVLFRDAAAIERLREVNVLIVDKTGTLTEGRPSFHSVIAAAGQEQNEVLRLAASLDLGSEHPLARALVDEARRRKLALSAASAFESASGIGVRGQVEDKVLALGNTVLMAQQGVDCNAMTQK